MSSPLEREIGELKKSLLEMAETVDSMLTRAVALIRQGRSSPETTAEIKEMDDKVDASEIAIDAKCIRLLSLYAPEAEMLRTVVTVLSINNDLERIGDHAVNIARLVGKIPHLPPARAFSQAADMGDDALEMLRMSMDAFINKKKELAYRVTQKDEEVDEAEKQIIRGALEYLKKFPEATQEATCLIVIARNLERAADLSTNISEDAHYLITGEVRKHASITRPSET